MSRGGSLEVVELEVTEPLSPPHPSLELSSSLVETTTEVRGARDESWKFPSKELEKHLITKEEIQFIDKKKRAFYKHQNQLIHDMLETERTANKINTEEEDDEDAQLSAFQLRAKKARSLSLEAPLLFRLSTDRTD